jgi:tRNA pseudouridine38-40 synthase
VARRFGVLLGVAYDGTAFRGWAQQKATQGASASPRTVEETLAGAITKLDPRASGPRGASRTDAGVHAEGQLAAFDAALEIPPRGWVLALNQHMPDDACVRWARPVPLGYAPRFEARGKRYRYRVLLDRIRDPLLRDRAWRIGWAVDRNKLEREARLVVGTHDFAAFRSSHDARNDTVRTIARCDVVPEEGNGGRVLGIVVEGKAFLYNMVRIVVGTLMDVARGHLAEGAISRALVSRSRGDAGMTAPAHGLVLEHVDVALPAGAEEPWPPR